MASSSLRIGVIGVGFGTAVQIPGFQSEGVEVTSVCARRRERAQEAADRFGIPGVYDDYHNMLRDAPIDAVSIVSPIPLHHPMTMAALDAGKHVLCEKPFALDQTQAREMWRKAESTGLTNMIGHEFRFASARMRVKELIEEGYVGPLHLVLMRLVNGPRRGFEPRPLTDRDDAAQGGGFLWGLGSHYIDCLRHWFGEVTSVSGHVATRLGERTLPDSDAIVQATADDSFNFTLGFAQGGWATMTGTNAAPFGSGASVEIYGRNGTLVTPHEGTGVNPPPHGTLLGAQAGDDALAEIPIPERLQPFADDRDGRLMPFRLMVREFVRGVQEGTSPVPNFYDGFRCQQVLDAVRESSATGRVVQILQEI
ncbi:Gfo/Idh/MocA family oxidoreductase [SAR202 cluster bacterium AC-647-N09_OGT_505m]|nr:Gfo/Idh/MocA family oxidoreductase [SAR202 cluster bacterium AC-647-N09_OGT_505m]